MPKKKRKPKATIRINEPNPVVASYHRERGPNFEYDIPFRTVHCGLGAVPEIGRADFEYTVMGYLRPDGWVVLLAHRNVADGMKLMDKALRIYPDCYPTAIPELSEEIMDRIYDLFMQTNDDHVILPVMAAILAN